MKEEKEYYQMNGKRVITDYEFFTKLEESVKKTFNDVWQTNLHGIWVDGYMFCGFEKIRKVWREI